MVRQLSAAKEKKLIAKFSELLCLIIERGLLSARIWGELKKDKEHHTQILR
jgi:hypothetical protein